MTTTQKIWNHKTNESFNHEADLFRAVDDYIGYLDYIVENCNGGKRTTDDDDFRALEDCWRKSTAARAVESFDVLDNSLNIVSECVAEAVGHLNDGWADDETCAKFYTELNAAFSAARAVVESMRQTLDVSIAKHYFSAVASMIEKFDRDDRLTNTRIYKGFKIGGEAFFLTISDTDSEPFANLGDRFGFGDDYRPGLELKLTFDVETFVELYSAVDNDVFGLMFGDNDDYETAERMIDVYNDWLHNYPVDVHAAAGFVSK